MKSEILDVQGLFKDAPICFHEFKTKTMFKFSEFMYLLTRAFETKGMDALGDFTKPKGGIPVWGDGEREKWLGEGVPCEILRPGEVSWKKGKLRIKISLEFEPNEETNTESDLDALRQMKDLTL